MILRLNHNPLDTVEVFFEDFLKLLKIPYKQVNAYQIHLENDIDEELFKSLLSFLDKFNIEILQDPKIVLVSEIKNHLLHYIESDSEENISTFLSDKMNYSYSYLSKNFREVALCSIEEFVLFLKLEKVIQLAMHEELSLTEISYKMGYSSVSYLSRFFKKQIGMSFQEFQYIAEERKKRLRSGN